MAPSHKMSLTSLVYIDTLPFWCLCNFISYLNIFMDQFFDVVVDSYLNGEKSIDFSDLNHESEP